MAENKRNTRTKRPLVDMVQEESKNDFERVVEHARENPMLYAAAAVFVVFCILAGIFFRLEKMDAEVESATAYARALDTEDPALRVAALEKVADEGSRWSAEATYMAGEAAIEAMDYEKARELFERVRDDYAKSQYVPAALDGLAFIAENSGDFEAALAGYRAVYTEHTSSFVAQRQPLNIGRVLEKLEKWAEAKAAYEEQTEVFPDSQAAMQATQALDQLRTSHPDLFPAEAEATVEDEGASQEEAEPDADSGTAAP